MGACGSVWELSDKNHRVVKSQSWLDWCSVLQVDLEALAIHLWGPRRSGAKQWSTWVHQLKAWERQQQAWEHLELLKSSLEKILSSLGMLLVCLKMVVTTYYWTFLNTYVFRLNAQLCIYVSIYQFIYTQYVPTVCGHCLIIIWGAPDDAVQASLETDLWRPWFCEHGCSDCVRLETD